jgi:hypothetical protein
MDCFYSLNDEIGMGMRSESELEWPSSSFPHKTQFHSLAGVSPPFFPFLRISTRIGLEFLRVTDGLRKQMKVKETP